jgi:hypothetical protein
MNILMSPNLTSGKSIKNKAFPRVKFSLRTSRFGLNFCKKFFKDLNEENICIYGLHKWLTPKFTGDIIFKSWGCWEGLKMVQTISKNKLPVIVIILLFIILSNLYFLAGNQTKNNPLTNDYWSQIINDLSNQAIVLKDHKPIFYFIYKPFRLIFIVFRLFRFKYQIFHSFINFPILSRVIGCYFLIFYQLSRTSIDSDAYILNYHVIR